jgi:hypothetical protein
LQKINPLLIFFKETLTNKKLGSNLMTIYIIVFAIIIISLQSICATENPFRFESPKNIRTTQEVIKDGPPAIKTDQKNETITLTSDELAELKNKSIYTSIMAENKRLL